MSAIVLGVALIVAGTAIALTGLALLWAEGERNREDRERSRGGQ